MEANRKQRNIRKFLAVILSFSLVVCCGFPSITATAKEQNSQKSEYSQTDKDSVSKTTEEKTNGAKNESSVNSEQQEQTNKDEVSEDKNDEDESAAKKKDGDKEDNSSTNEQVASLASLEANEAKEVAGPAAVYVPFAVYSSDDNSLRIYNRGDPVPSVGSTYNGHTVSSVFSNFDGRAANTNPAWVSDATHTAVKYFIVEDSYKPTGATDLVGFAAALTNCIYADVTYVDTSSATTLLNFFCDDPALVTVRGTQKWDTSNVTNIQGFAARCLALQQLNLSSWNTKKVDQAHAAFGVNNDTQTTALTHIFVGENFDLSSATNTTFLFGGDSKLPGYNTAATGTNQDKTYAKLTSSGGYLETAVCKIESTSSTTAALYYSSVVSAIQAATGTAIITVFKDNTTAKADLDITSKNITLKNETSSGFDWTGASAVTSWPANDQRWTIMNTGTLTLDGVIFDGTNYTHSNPFIIVYTGSPTLNVKGETVLRNHSAGAALDLLNTSGTINMSGGTITGNAGGIRIDSSATSSTINITGGSIVNNTGNSSVFGGAVGPKTDGLTLSAINISGNPIIENNTKDGVACNVITSGASLLKVNDFEDSAKIGIYSQDKYTENAQFTTGAKSANTIKNLTSALSNDRISDLKAVVVTGAVIVWGKPTCKVVSSNCESHYTDLGFAITGASNGDTVEIYKSHTINSTTYTTGRNITIKNITTPSNNDEDPSYNGSADTQPVVTFAKSGRVGVSSDVVFEGVIFDGASTTRTTSGVIVGTGSTLTLRDGVSGKHADGTDLAKTESVFKNFVNTNTSSLYTGGGFIYTNGTVAMEGGTITGCKSSSSGWQGGGAVANINGGTFNMKAGTIKNNGNSEVTASSNLSDGPFNLIAGTFNMTGGLVTENESMTGGLLTTPETFSSAATINISGGSITNNHATYDGGVVFLRSGAVCNITGSEASSPTISGNTSDRGGSIVEIRNGSTLNISGNPTMTGNKNTSSSDYAGAICACTQGSNNYGTVYVSGSPVITGNTRENSDKEANIVVSLTDHLQVNNLDDGAQIGVYAMTTSMDGDGEQFASGVITADAITHLTTSFQNDKDSTLVAIAGSDKAIIWGNPVCKVVKADCDVYFRSLSDAINASQSGETVEIFKTLTFSDKVDTSGKDIEIKNITNPKKDLEDPTKNGSSDIKPVVKFDTSAQLQVQSVVSLTGIVFDGQSAERSIPGVTVASGASLTINDGEAGTLEKTDTIVQNFINSTASLPTEGNSGGFVFVAGTVTMNGGTVKNCQSYSSGWSGGGAVACIVDGTFNLAGGTITQNGRTSNTSGFSETPFYLAYGTFNMTGGLVTENSATCGGCVTTGTDWSTTQAGTISITGGEISKNTCSYDGGAVFIGKKSVCTISGDVKITENESWRSGSAAEIRAGGTLNISGSPTITNNKCTFKTEKKECFGAINSYMQSASGGNSGIVNISGSPVIFGNTRVDGTDVQEANIVDSIASNIVVDDLGEGAKIGIYPINGSLDSAGEQFATGAKTASDITNLPSTFTNDISSSLVSFDGEGTKIVWGNESYPVTLKKTITKAQTTDTWFVVRVRRSNDGAEYRQAIKVDAGSTEGSATVVLQSREEYEFSDADEQSSWRFGADSTSFANFADTDTCTLGGVGESYLAKIKLSEADTESRDRTITFATSCADETYRSDSSSVVNTMN